MRCAKLIWKGCGSYGNPSIGAKQNDDQLVNPPSLPASKTLSTGGDNANTEGPAPFISFADGGFKDVILSQPLGVSQALLTTLHFGWGSLEMLAFLLLSLMEVTGMISPTSRSVIVNNKTDLPLSDLVLAPQLAHLLQF